MSFYPFTFEAEVTTYDVGSARYLYTVVWLPEALHKELPLDQHPRLRVTGEMNEQPFASALMPVPGKSVPGSRATRRWYLLLSKKQLKAMDSEVGDTVHVRFAVDDQDAVDVPPLLASALRKNSRMQKRWDALTAGKRRGLAYRVASAKRAETQAKRIAEVFDTLSEA
ncbi:MAG: YdeI/OmpD-associated family protein [Planctomycetota bacterium]